MLVAALAIPAGLFAATLFLPWYALRGSGLNLVIAFACIGVPWLLVGGLLLRGAPRQIPA